MKLKIATPKGEKIMEPDGSFIIGSTIHEKIFEYPVKFSGDGSFSVSFPKKELNGWYINNLPMLGFKTPWGRIKCRFLPRQN